MYPRFKWIADLYYCGIPLNCRHCDYLKQCRAGFWKGRKCYNGCIKENNRRDYSRRLDRKDYIDNLVKSIEEEEGNYYDK